MNNQKEIGYITWVAVIRRTRVCTQNTTFDHSSGLISFKAIRAWKTAQFWEILVEFLYISCEKENNFTDHCLVCSGIIEYCVNHWQWRMNDRYKCSTRMTRPNDYLLRSYKNNSIGPNNTSIGELYRLLNNQHINLFMNRRLQYIFIHIRFEIKKNASALQKS